jgi:hypothetical protein
MKPYGDAKLKGLAGRRRSTDTPHRRRCLRVDKKRARRNMGDYFSGRMEE